MNLQVIDDAVPAALFVQFQDWFANLAMLPGWRASKTAPGSFWHRNFVLSGIFNHHYSPGAVNPGMTHEALISQAHPLAQIARQFSEQHFAGLAFSRVWINVQGFGEDAAVHRDFEREYDGRSRAAVWYPMPAWDIDWAGDFTVWNDANEIVRSVAIKPNRLVIFDGNPPHAARPLSRFATERRVSVAFGREVME